MNKNWVKYAQLEVERRELEDRLEAVKEEMTAMQPELLEVMLEGELDKITLAGITFSPRRRLYAAPAEGFSKHDVAEALVACDLGDYVKSDYNANSLSAYVAAFDKETDEVLTPADIQERLPEGLRQCLRVGEIWSIGTTKTGSRKKAARISS